ncbi:hypothetical protein CGZ80_21265 [Rhodopirellula sp. MGV]|nr:hypothetical protein CGZ80_21265 [Rhodopirellula sp. MGV]PNY36051.1 hypothetical protein C2E31_15160 [Rhodopirellula baltica]
MPNGALQFRFVLSQRRLSLGKSSGKVRYDREAKSDAQKSTGGDRLVPSVSTYFANLALHLR